MKSISFLVLLFELFHVHFLLVLWLKNVFIIFKLFVSANLPTYMSPLHTHDPHVWGRRESWVWSVQSKPGFAVRHCKEIISGSSVWIALCSEGEETDLFSLRDILVLIYVNANCYGFVFEEEKSSSFWCCLCCSLGKNFWLPWHNRNWFIYTWNLVFKTDYDVTLIEDHSCVTHSSKLFFTTLINFLEANNGLQQCTSSH